MLDIMLKKSLATKVSLIGLSAGILILCLQPAMAQNDYHPVYWEIHDEERPQPPVVDPGRHTGPVPAPEDAKILLDGTELSEWESSNGGEAPWNVEDGYIEVEPGSGDIQTREEFGDVQLYVEWAAPEEIDGDGQGRGNSGVFLMQQYEVQVLDSYENPTYPDGQAASLYGQYPPLKNASRPPGEWQTFNIIFRRPHFDKNDNLVKPARVTVFHNGILVIDNVELTGRTAHYDRPPYEAHADQLPIRLQDHSDKVRFRNIWVRELE